MTLTIIVFLLVYVAMGFGKLPGFKVDRTGAAVIGALAMMAIGSITPPHAWNAIDYRTIGMLFGLMVVSASFVVSGFYSWTANRVAMLKVSPPALLAVLIGVGGILSALLTNDVVVVAMTPLLVSISLSRGLNPIPFLLGFCFAANNGAAGSLIGSPQNMIAAQGLDISFVGLLEASAIPALISLPITWLVLVWLYRNRWYIAKDEMQTKAPTTQETLNVWETTKAGIITFAVIIAFIISDIPRELIALTAAGFLLMNRSIASSDMLKLVDGNLLLLIMGLFVVNAAFASTGIPQQLLNDLRAHGVDLNNPLALFLVTGVLSTIVGNNPSVMLLVPFLTPDGNADSLGAALVLGSGFSSNLLVFGSLAGIIVVEQAAAYGVKISFSEFAKSGGIVAALCMMLAAIWVVLVL
ncbi:MULTISPECIES: SLC13 family permease [Providencia]|jgi:Na+/H+ antiporter NhaD/arsenite permease-like protein|uniref:SLC13 family permease n=1 Tax=Providencia TaxID=586 RepID=UPI001C5BD254|nr:MULTISPECIES: SLC13 family permease [Providencia]ELR5149409.1 transporter [Providencia rettgeri]MDR2224411.1 transporter [Providencia sp.]QXX83599.1 transporter [Providencia sp. R33]